MAIESQHKRQILEQVTADILRCRSDVVGVVAFGSFLSAEQCEDIDLLVVVEELHQSPLERKGEVLALKEAVDVPLPLDVLLLSRDECEDSFNAHVPLFLDIALDGQVLHDSNSLEKLMDITRAYMIQRGIVRTETGGWRYPVDRRRATPLSKVTNQEWIDIWMADAERDMRAATVLLNEGIFEKCVTHCQQALEKAAKCVLMCFGRYEKTHYVAQSLATELEGQDVGPWADKLNQVAGYARSLEPDATLSRYPGIVRGRVWVPHREYDKETAQQALHKAQSAVQIVAGFLEWWFAEEEVEGGESDVVSESR